MRVASPGRVPKPANTRRTRHTPKAEQAGISKVIALPVTLHQEPRLTWLPEVRTLWQALLDSQVPVQDTDRAMAWIILDTLDKALRAEEPNASLIIGCFNHLSRFGVAHADRARSGVHSIRAGPKRGHNHQHSTGL